MKSALIKKLGPGLGKRFGKDFHGVGMITVQLYLPADNSNKNIGTIFHERLPDGTKPRATQMPFAPNSGYAFAVWNDTWHSVDPVGPEVKTRDSILR